MLVPLSLMVRIGVGDEIRKYKSEITHHLLSSFLYRYSRALI